MENKDFQRPSDEKKFGIGAVGLSMPAEDFRPEAIRASIDELRNKGFHVIVGETVFTKSGYKTAPTQKRLEDLESMFKDKSVDVILNTTGGFNSNDLLDKLDYSMIEENPKWFVGYSDITALNLALYTRSKLHTVNGPMLVDNAFEPTSLDRLMPVLEKKSASFDQPASVWDNRFTEREKTLRQLGDIQSLPSKKKQANGKVIVGNLSTFNLLLGTPYFPQVEDPIYFLEYDKEEKHALAAIERFLQQLRLGNIFENTKGLVFGMLEHSSLREENDCDSLKRILTDVTEGYDFPVLWNAVFGHSYPSWPLINGQKISIDGPTIFPVEAVSSPSFS